MAKKDSIHSIVLPVVLVAIGFGVLYVSQLLRSCEEYYVLVLTVGATLVATAIAYRILSTADRRTAKMMDEKWDSLVSSLPLLPDAKNSGIQRIFNERRDNEEYKDELLSSMVKQEDDKPVLIISNTLRDFFITEPSPYLTAFLSMLERGVKVRLILLHPISTAATERAKLEEKCVADNFNYLNSTLYEAIKKVVYRLNSKSIAHQGKTKDAIDKNLEVRFTYSEPSTHLFILSSCVYVEQYHSGGDKKMLDQLIAQGMSGVKCFGGFVPVLKLDRCSRFALLLESHFMNMWDTCDDPVNKLSDELWSTIMRYEEGSGDVV